MIQIDDAGSGSLIGGTCIGVMRKETGEYLYSIIPLALYQKDNFEKKYYLDYVVDIIKTIFLNLKVSNHEKIEVCRGYMFDKLRLWFKENGYQFTSTTIEDPLQTKIENTFEQYAISLGLPHEFLNYTKYPFHFHRLLRWVYADYEHRNILCKKGWKSWEKYGNLNLQINISYLKKSNYKCLKCWKDIKDHSLVKTIKYTSNRPNIIYLHTDC